MKKTIGELQAELSDKTKGLKKAKERTSTLYQELLESRKHTKMLIGQYERVIKEWKVTAQELQSSMGKIFFVFLYEKYQRMKQKLGRG